MPTPHSTVPADSRVQVPLENITRKGEGIQHGKHDLFEALQNLCKSVYLVAFPLSLQKTINIDYNCASSHETLTVACEQQMRRSACAPRSLISTFVVRPLISITIKLTTCKVSLF